MIEPRPRGFRTRLVRRARRAGVDLPVPLAERLVAYYELLELWNRKINLTAIDEPDEAIDRLLVEPLLAARHLPATARSVLDVGSGGGSPAVPVKLARPDLSLTMVESKARKAAFLWEVVRQLRLTGVHVEAARYEELLTRPDLHEAFDVITLRAVKIDARIMMNLQAFLKPGGSFGLFRSTGDTELPDSLPPSLIITARHPLVETLRSQLVVVEKRRVGLA